VLIAARACRRTLLAALVLVVASFVPVAPAAAIEPVNTKAFRKQVTVDGIVEHLTALQDIADRNGGNRASGTTGYDASVDYVRGVLEAAGYEVTEQELTFPFSRELSPAEVQQISSTATSYGASTLLFSATGDVTGRLVPTRDVQIPPRLTSSGCQAADFVPASAIEPQVALVQRGFCSFAEKATNARNAGYDAVAVFNEGRPGGLDLFNGSINAPAGIPVVGLSFADGAALYAATSAGPVVLRVRTETEIDPAATTSNVLADTRTGDPDNVLVVGAHLDSVLWGPGINDNGSGVAVLLEVAEQLAAHPAKLRSTVRFAFWGDEEAGLVGSEHYVQSLNDDELGRIFANLNFDMLGSPNYARFVYDGDGRPTCCAGPPGSGQLEEIFTSYFASQGLATSPIPFVGRSDYQAFMDVGIPSGGLFSGAELRKSPGEAQTYGGTAFEPYDASYHQAGDTIDNLSRRALDELGDGVAHAVYTLGRSKTDLFGDKIKKKKAKDRAAGTPTAARAPANAAGHQAASHQVAGHDCSVAVR
jgi:Zn-dependent M28 family amino/carboxypeptidase